MALSLPMLQHVFQLAKERKLNGVIETRKMPVFRLENFLNGLFQDSLDIFLNDHMGFRPDFVRLNNQIQYHLFDVAKGRDIIIGKKDCLYGLDYIMAATGSDFIGLNAIQKKMRQVQKINEVLESQGKHLILLFAPGKGTYYPEYIPDRFPIVNDSLNIDFFVQEAGSHRLNIFDANKWFRAMKDTSKHCLYPLHGIHWSAYGQALVMDSLESLTEKMLSVDIPDYTITGVEKSKVARDTDDDMEKGCNLLFPLPAETLSYPLTAYNEENKVKPKMLVIGDSFFFNLIAQCNVLFDNLHFLYYFREDHNVPALNMKPIDENFDLKATIENTEIVMIVITDAQLPRFAWGFFDAMDSSYQKSGY